MFEDRLKGYEAKFQHDEEVAFHVRVRRDRRFGLWAAHRLGLAGTPAEDYADALVNEFGPHHASKIQEKVAADLAAAGLAPAPNEVAAAFAAAHREAERDVAEKGEG